MSEWEHKSQSLREKAALVIPNQLSVFKDVRDHTGRIVTEHLWFNYTKGFMKLGLQVGDVVQFDARVKAYEKGYKGWRDDVWNSPIETDYKLSHPTMLVKLHLRSADRSGCAV